MGLFGGCAVNGASVAACSKQMHTQLIQRQHVLKVVHQLKKVDPPCFAHATSFDHTCSLAWSLSGTSL